MHRFSTVWAVSGIFFAGYAFALYRSDPLLTIVPISLAAGTAFGALLGAAIS